MHKKSDYQNKPPPPLHPPSLSRSQSSAVVPVCFMGFTSSSLSTFSFRSQLLFKSKQQASSLPSSAFPSLATPLSPFSCPISRSISVPPSPSPSPRLRYSRTMQSGGTASQKLSASFCPATSYNPNQPRSVPLSQPLAYLKAYTTVPYDNVAATTGAELAKMRDIPL